MQEEPKNQPRQAEDSPSEERASPAVHAAVDVDTRATTIARVAVLASARVPIGRAQLMSDGTIQLSWSNERQDEAREIGEALKAQLPVGTGATRDERWSALRTLLVQRGLDVVDLPAGDFETTVHVDLATGRVLGETASLHPFQDADSPVVQSVFAALKRVPAVACAETLAALDEALARDDHDAAARAITEQVGTFFGPARPILEAARRVDVLRLSAELAAEFVRERLVLAAASRDHTAATAADIQWIRERSWSSFSAEQQAQIRLFEGAIAKDSGRTEEAYAICKEVATVADASARAWALSNMCHLLNPSDPEALRLAERAADAFLEAGDHQQAACLALRQAKQVLPEDPTRGLRIVDDALAWFDSSLAGRDVRAGLLHARALALLTLRRFEDAAASARSAADLRAGIQGIEAERASSLAAAAFALRSLGRDDEAEGLEKQADGLIDASGSEDAQLDREVARLTQDFDAKRAEELRALARQLGNVRTEAFIAVLIGSHANVPHAERLRILEEAVQLLRANRASQDDIDVANAAIAVALEGAGEAARALTFWRAIVANDPLHLAARRNTAALLQKLERWEESAAFFAAERARFGDSPELLYLEGRSLVEAGKAASAVSLLHRAVALSADEDDVKAHAQKWRDIALDQCGGQPAAATTPIHKRVVTRAELHAEVREFAALISGEKRGAFWRSSGGQRRWTEKPERVAQNLLFVFLRAKFGEQAVVLEEIAAGAGRLDLFVICEGGFRAVIELKMLGGGYSLTYALQGEDQVTHYMANRGAGVGFLVVFDAREAFGTGIEPTTVSDGATVHTVFVDVRPTWKKGEGGGEGDP